ncbi:MAG: 5-(carboxyamino)imidazole ribonucleotide mutase [Ignavibacteria bacterium]|nr:5-(carboxyamino)imidazole ribonucleotide mutase [Ignavibacteria bacterium]
MSANKNFQVAILMGSDSDLPVMNQAAEVLTEFEIKYQIRILSAHRVPHKLQEYVKEAEEKGVKVFIAGAGLAAHLPGVIAAFTTRPVIGVPLASGALKGIDSLLAIVQMPSGVPVATVAIDGSKNAALLAIQILASANPILNKKLLTYKKKMEDEVLRKDSELNKS